MDQGKATGSPAAEIVTPASHTPLPWHFSRKFRYVSDINHRVIAEVSPLHGFAANAALIVRAVNNHDALMNALYMARGQLVTLGGDAQGLYADRIQKYVLDTINSALAAASSFSGPLMTDDSSRKDSGEVNQ
jgi:hypothetical protein